MKACVLIFLSATALAHEELPKWTLTAPIVELPIPALQPLHAPPLRLHTNDNIGVMWRTRLPYTFGGGLPALPSREPRDAVRIVSEAFRGCTSVILTLFPESEHSVRWVLGDGSEERHVFTLVVDALLNEGVDWKVSSLDFIDQNLAAATEYLEFTPDILVTFAAADVIAVRFDLSRSRALLTDADHWDFYSVDAVGTKALRTLLEERTKPNQSPEPTATAVTPPAAQEPRQP